MNALFGILFLALSAFFADEKAAYEAAHDFCPDTFVTRVDDRSHFECEGVAYVAFCDDGACEIEPLAVDDGGEGTRVGALAP